MATKRKYSKGLAKNLLCFLRSEGAAKGDFLQKRFRFSHQVIGRTLAKLESNGLVLWRVGGGYAVTPRGSLVAAKACPGQKHWSDLPVRFTR